MGQLWIEFTDENGAEGSAQWGDPVPDSVIEAVIDAAIDITGRQPDTIY